MATQRKQASEQPQHILLLGASGVSGLAFIQYQLSLTDTDPTKPYLTLYIRGSGRSKLTPVLPSSTTNDNPAPRIRIIEGSLTDKAAIGRALSPSSAPNTATSFPKVTAVISVLGAYMSLYYFITRQKPTPISDALTSTIIPAMLDQHITRILVLSTPTAFPVPGEAKAMSWSWYFQNMIPTVVVPQGSAEMKGIGNAVLDNSDRKTLRPKRGLEATVFRVPMMTSDDEEGRREVRAFELGGKGNTERKDLSRASMVRWLVEELERKEWVGGAPMLCNVN